MEGTIAPYKSVWKIIDSKALEKARSDDKYDEFYMIICDSVMRELVTPRVWDRCVTDDQKQSWAEYHVWMFAHAEEEVFPGDTTLIDDLVNRLQLTMNEPRILDVMQELEDNRRAMEQRVTPWAGLERQAKYVRMEQLRKMGPYRYAKFRELKNRESRITALQLERDAEGIKIVELFTTEVNGRPPFNIEFEPTKDSNVFISALSVGLYQVALDLGVTIDMEWYGLDCAILEKKVYGEAAGEPTLLIWAESNHPIDYQAVARDPESFRRPLENAHKVLKFWKWCVEMDHERGIPLTTLQQAHELLKKRGRFKNLWLRDCGEAEESLEDDDEVDDKFTFLYMLTSNFGARSSSSSYTTFQPTQDQHTSSPLKLFLYHPDTTASQSIHHQRYRSVWHTITEATARIGISVSDTIEICKGINEDMKGIKGYEIMSDDQRQCWMEWHLWEEHFSGGPAFPGDKSILTAFYEERKKPHGSNDQVQRAGDIESTLQGFDQCWAWRIAKWEDRKKTMAEYVKDRMQWKEIRAERRLNDPAYVARVAESDAFYKLHPLQLRSRGRRYPTIEIAGDLENETAFKGAAPDSIKKIEAELGLAFDVAWYLEEGVTHRIQAHAPLRDGGLCLKKPEVVKERLERASEALHFWEWCITRDYRARITLTTFPEAYEEIKRAGSEAVKEWKEEKAAFKACTDYDEASFTYAQRMKE
ncbi:uncharacterized protein LY89DRAFT_721739 [Mollisia scopiformis]|uniref:Uncharacterized protein n=1 Tax=Mollisia scopiformis TaxID=149040 RepID=A0A194WYZ0_MOLSC|nr:uncharacterized protein LY89DRAFT_721739 [Mollisia scopiformis]KUJ12909.1 hypothetical protein LY89DRAFT_721739 [Mollisia scopiformis]